MAARMAAFDWSATPIGPVSRWPQSLCTAVGICLSSRYPMLIWWGPDLIMLYNDGYAPMLGPVKHPALGRPGREVWAEIWHIVGEQLRSVLSTGRPTWSDDQVLPMLRFGYLEEAYFTYSYSVIHDETGAVGGVFTAVSETTQRVLGERRLRTLRALGEAATVVAGTGQVTTAEQVCRAALRTLAASRADVPFAGAYLLDQDGARARLVAAMGLRADAALLPAELPAAQADPALWQAVVTGETRTLRGLAERHPQAVLPGASPAGDQPCDTALALPVLVNGRERAAGLLVAGVTPYRELDEDYRGFFNLLTDQVSRAVGDADAFEAQRRRAEALAELDRAKSEFFANVSHELRTPLTLIAGPAEDALADQAEPLGPGQRGRMEIIRRNAGRLRRLVDDMLDFARIEAGWLRPELVAADLTAVTSELIASFAPAVERAGLELRTDFSPLPRPVPVDMGMWEKVVLNLLSNAVKYTLHGRIDVSLRAVGRMLELSVRDTGIGIPAAELPRLFQRFYRVRSTAGRSHEGAGIGLALVAELVRLHGGTVGAESAEGAGSTFTVRLPYDQVPADLPGAPPVRPSTAYVDEALQWAGHPAEVGLPGDTGGARVLVVEDNADLRRFIAGLLEPNWQVLQAADGRTGLELARAHRPDLVLTDVMMPGLDGFGLLAALRADPRTAATPVVILSARAGEEAAVQGLEAGADDYLPKPFSAVELRARVRSNLEMARFRNRESQFRRALLDSLQEGFFITDDQGTILEANQALFAIVGYDAGGLPIRWPYPWVPDTRTDPEANAQLEHALADGLKRGGGRYTLPVRHRDGRTVWLTCSSVSLPDRDGHARLFVGTARDITSERLSGQREATLAAFAAALAAAGEISEVLTTAAREIAAALHASRVTVAMWSGDGPPAVTGWPRTPGIDPSPAAAGALDAARHEPAASVAVMPGDGGASLLVAPLDGVGTSAIAAELPAARTVRAEERELFLVLTSHLAQVLAKARDYEQARAVALTLQHAILGPTQLPHGFAVRYTPAVAPLEVGGDWYDVVPMPGHRTGVVVGDCVGRGLPAAAVMGQLRSASQAVLLRASGPAEALADLDTFARRIPAAECTSVFCAVIDPAAATVSYSSAGHPPPILVAPGGGRRLLDQAQSLPLAVLPGAVPRREASVALPAGATLLLYTDGLVERRNRHLDEGISAAADLVADHGTKHPEELADLVMAGMMPAAGYDDDVAVLIYRHPPAPLNMRVVANPANLARIRAGLRLWLASAGIGAREAADILTAAGEAAANAVEHATADGDEPVQVTVTARATHAAVETTIADTGTWRAPRPGAGNRGHGIVFMRTLMDDVAITTSEHGTTVTMTKEL
jgi:PAS domain S-box-containing protein